MNRSLRDTLLALVLSAAASLAHAAGPSAVAISDRSRRGSAHSAAQVAYFLHQPACSHLLKPVCNATIERGAWVDRDAGEFVDWFI